MSKFAVLEVEGSPNVKATIDARGSHPGVELEWRSGCLLVSVSEFVAVLRAVSLLDAGVDSAAAGPDLEVRIIRGEDTDEDRLEIWGTPKGEPAYRLVGLSVSGWSLVAEVASRVLGLSGR